MNTQQPKALRLAHDIHCGDSACKCSLNLAAAELRRLHAELELQKALVAEAQAMTAKVCAENEELKAQESELVSLYGLAQAEEKTLRHEHDKARSQYEFTVEILLGIYGLLYPPVFTTPDGVKMAFRPKSLDPHDLLQELSDRIRAVPDQIAARKEGGAA